MTARDHLRVRVHDELGLAGDGSGARQAGRDKARDDATEALRAAWRQPRQRPTVLSMLRALAAPERSQGRG